MRTISYKEMAEKAQNVLESTYPNWAEKSNFAKRADIKHLMRIAYKNKQGVAPDKVKLENCIDTEHRCIKYVDCYEMTEAMYNRFEEAIAETCGLPIAM